MATSYKIVKLASVKLIDDFTDLDIVAGYGDKYSAKTKLSKIGLNAPVLAVMPPRVNKAMRPVIGSSWRRVGPADLVVCATIGDFILLMCGQGGVVVPQGEPT